MTRIAWLFGVLAGVGCDRVFGLERPPDATPPEPLCTLRLLDDGFDTPGASACAPWGGSTTINATLELEASELVARSMANQPGTAGCTYGSLTPFVDGGVMLEVTRASLVPSGYLVFQAFPPGDPYVSAAILISGNTLSLQKTGMNESIVRVPYDPAKHRWWRLRPDPLGAGVIAEVGPDDETLTMLGIATGTVPLEVKLNFISGNDPEPGTQVAAFGAVRICSTESR